MYLYKEFTRVRVREEKSVPYTPSVASFHAKHTRTKCPERQLAMPYSKDRESAQAANKYILRIPVHAINSRISGLSPLPTLPPLPCAKDVTLSSQPSKNIEELLYGFSAE